MKEQADHYILIPGTEWGICRYKYGFAIVIYETWDEGKSITMEMLK
jgi:hypothetical protein